MQAVDEARIYADKALLNQLKEKYPETGGMTFTGLVEWAIRKLLEIKGAQ
jgi:hypothetical protein